MHTFVASSVENQKQAKREVRRWARGQGYGLPLAAPTFTIFRPDAEPREWVFLEKPTSKH